MMRLEQEGVHLHKEFYSLEKLTLFKAKRYVDMLKEHVNKLYSTRNCDLNDV
jgi:hypothetical protein